MSYQQELHYTTDKLSGFERLRVDVAQTGFFEGREFRTFRELNIAASATYVVKVLVPINIILMSLGVDLDQGYLRIGTYLGGSEGGSFSEILPAIGANNMAAGINRRRSATGALYASQLGLTAGGTHSGGTELDVLRVKTAGNSNQGSSIGTESDSVRGVAANTYYIRLLNLSATDAALGVFSARWEERPAGFFQT